VNTIFVYRNGATEQTTRIERAWLNPASGAVLWVDLQSPSIPESLLLSDTFAFHPLAVEDALSSRERPKLEAYEGYLFLVLQDARLFVGPHVLVTVSGGAVRAIDEMRDNVAHNQKLLGDGSVALCHRIVDEMVDGYAPAVAALAERLDAIVAKLADKPAPGPLLRDVLTLQSDIAGWRHRLAAEGVVVERLARREFIDISTEMAFRFRDVHDHLLAAGDELAILSERLPAVVGVVSALAAGGRRWI
jgi:magnesium transporter